MTNPQDESLKTELSRIEAMIKSPKTRNLRERVVDSSIYVRPKFASTLLLIDRSSDEPKVLMGKRNKSLKFMPGALVFPGGSVDRSDGNIESVGELHTNVEQRIANALRSKATPKRGRSLALAAVREVAEESGLLLGKPGVFSSQNPQWADFSKHEIVPDIAQLRLFGRAVTPPGMPRRFDTWFFLADKSVIGHVPQGGFDPDGELEDLQWISPMDAINGPTREITRVLLVELMNRLQNDPGLEVSYPAPQYMVKSKSFTRSEI